MYFYCKRHDALTVRCASITAAILWPACVGTTALHRPHISFSTSEVSISFVQRHHVEVLLHRGDFLFMSRGSLVRQHKGSASWHCFGMLGETVQTHHRPGTHSKVQRTNPQSCTMVQNIFRELAKREHCYGSWYAASLVASSNGTIAQGF
jgi:hypothetical protein